MTLQVPEPGSLGQESWWSLWLNECDTSQVLKKLDSNDSMGEEVNLARKEIRDMQKEYVWKGTSFSSSLCNQYLSTLEAFDLPAQYIP